MVREILSVKHFYLFAFFSLFFFFFYLAGWSSILWAVLTKSWLWIDSDLETAMKQRWAKAVSYCVVSGAVVDLKCL